MHGVGENEEAPGYPKILYLDRTLSFNSLKEGLSGRKQIRGSCRWKRGLQPT